MVADIWGVPLGFVVAAVVLYGLWWLYKTADNKEVKK